MKNNFCNILTEGIISKYGTSLNEAWASSMPNWMKKVITPMAKESTPIYSSENSPEYQRAYKRAKELGYNERGALSYADLETSDSRKYNTGGFSNSSKFSNPDVNASNNIYNRFVIDLGIDLTDSNLKFTEGPYPKSNSDERLHTPNYGIWYIPSRLSHSDQIYVKGINDNEKLNPPKNVSGQFKYEGRPLGNLPLKQLAEISEGFCCLDLSNYTKKDFKELKKNRRDNYLDTLKMFNNGNARNTDISKSDKLNAQTAGLPIDASGYVNIESSKKYAKELKRLGMRNYADKLTAAEDIIKEIHRFIADSMIKIDPFNIPVDYIDNLKGCLSDIDIAVSMYEGILRTIDRVKITTNSDEDLIDVLLDERVEDRINNLYSFIGNAGLNMSKIGLTKIDI